MANYINQEILCEAYTHLNIDIFDNKEALQKLKNVLIPYFSERAKFLLGSEVEVRIEFEEGSLKTKLQVVGSAGLVLMNALSPATLPGKAVTGLTAVTLAYKPFKESIQQLSEDAKALAQSANLEVIFQTQTPYCDRVNIERRNGVFGRVEDLLAQLDNVASLVGNDDVPSNQIELNESIRAVERLNLWSNKADNLFEKISSPLTEECIAGGLLESIKNMPLDFAWEKKLNNGGLSSKIIKSDPQHYGQL